MVRKGFSLSAVDKPVWQPSDEEWNDIFVQLRYARNIAQNSYNGAKDYMDKYNNGKISEAELVQSISGGISQISSVFDVLDRNLDAHNQQTGQQDRLRLPIKYLDDVLEVYNVSRFLRDGLVYHIKEDCDRGNAEGLVDSFQQYDEQETHALRVLSASVHLADKAKYDEVMALYPVLTEPSSSLTGDTGQKPDDDGVDLHLVD